MLVNLKSKSSSIQLLLMCWFLICSFTSFGQKVTEPSWGYAGFYPSNSPAYFYSGDSITALDLKRFHERKDHGYYEGIKTLYHHKEYVVLKKKTDEKSTQLIIKNLQGEILDTLLDVSVKTNTYIWDVSISGDDKKMLVSIYHNTGDTSYKQHTIPHIDLKIYDLETKELIKELPDFNFGDFTVNFARDFILNEDGTQFVYSTGYYNNTLGTYLYNLETGQNMMICEDCYGAPQLSSNGNEVFCFRINDIYKYNIEDQSLKHLYRHHGSGVIQNPMVTPNGKHMRYYHEIMWVPFMRLYKFKMISTDKGRIVVRNRGFRKFKKKWGTEFLWRA